jgi:hypothetical protein
MFITPSSPKVETMASIKSVLSVFTSLYGEFQESTGEFVIDTGRAQILACFVPCICWAMLVAVASWKPDDYCEFFSSKYCTPSTTVVFI